jgi:membrane-bound serine protease (ClpP class)
MRGRKRNGASRRGWALICIGVAFSLLGAAAKEEGKPADSAAPRKFERPVVIRLQGEINPWQKGYFDRALAKAKKAGADLIVLEIDSPGGHLLESQEMAETLRDVN